MKHTTEKYLLDPGQPVTVNLVGVGGTGSQFLTCLARLNYALLGLGHAGFYVDVFDPDTVEEHNVGRQLFSASDVGKSKAVVLVERINKYFGFGWDAHIQYYDDDLREDRAKSNILVTCVDNIQSRFQARKVITQKSRYQTDANRAFYWLDMGNSEKSGQAVLGTTSVIKQPEGEYTSTLPNVIDIFPELLTQEEDASGPSCSLAEALGRQDLFINSTMAQFGANLIWKLFVDPVTDTHGVFVNLETMNVKPLKIK